MFSGDMSYSSRRKWTKRRLNQTKWKDRREQSPTSTHLPLRISQGTTKGNPGKENRRLHQRAKFFGKIKTKLSKEVNDELDAPITEKEVKKAIEN